MKNQMIKRILIPTDYSANAKRSAQIGIQFAKGINAEVFLFHGFGLQAIGVAESIAVVDQIKHDEGKRLDRYVNELKTEYGEVKIHGILEFGSAVDCIQKIVEDKKIDLIIMGTKGETDAVNSMLGSVASHVVNNVKCAVLIIPKGHRAYNINEVLFATDFHFTNNVATYLAPFLSMVEEYQPYVHVVQFNSERLTGTHVKSVEELKLKGLLSNAKHSFHYVEAEDTEVALFEFAEKHHCDLIVMVTHHYTLWERIFHRSLTKKIALHSEIPLLVLHED
jgi:nucleotide-binding universal stress UspA family protein